MKTHGGEAPYQAIFATPDAGAPAAAGLQTYRNFLRPPRAEEQYRLAGMPGTQETIDVLARAQLQDEARELLGRLDVCTRHAEIWSSPLQADRAPWENPSIPAGYTYLSQLVAHDLVLTSALFPSLQYGSETFRNNRSFCLDLDTLYGGGPGVCPAAYALSTTRGGLRTRLRLSAVQQKTDDRGASRPPFRDIGRGCVADGNDGQMFAGPTEALLADPRNDDNAVLSQLVTVFIHFHNATMARLEELLPRAESEPDNQWQERLFVLARRIVCDTYRAVVRSDLVPRLLHGDVLHHYETAPEPFIDTDASGAMPLEFSHAAFRFGHAMVRPHYAINAHHDFDILGVLRATSTREPWAMPFTQAWIVQWSRFFELRDEIPVNYSRRIGPSTSGRLSSEFTETERAEDPKSLMHRDLLRGASIGLWAVAPLVAEIARRQSRLTALSPLLADLPATFAGMDKWLQAQGLAPADSARISDNPPLFLFLLYEAMAEPGNEGRHLGVLGSIIVAETLLPALNAQAGIDDPTHVPAELFEAVTGRDTITTMPELLRVVAKIAGLEQASPAFL